MAKASQSYFDVTSETHLAVLSLQSAALIGNATVGQTVLFTF